MKAIVIYFDETKKRKQIIKPSEAFWKQGNDVMALVEHITKSHISEGIKKFHSFEII